MKTYSFSKGEMEYLIPVACNMNALDRGMQAYIITVVFKRLGLPNATQAQYNVERGELYVAEPSDLEKKEPATDSEANDTVKMPEKPEEQKNTEKAGEPKAETPASN